MGKRIVERHHAGGEWSTARFFSFLRSNIRKTSQKWPPIARLALNQARRAYVGDNRQQKWEYQCAKCSGWFKRTEVQVDHVIACGSLKSYEDLEGFCRRLFVESDSLEVLCIATCHAEKTKAARTESAADDE